MTETSALTGLERESFIACYRALAQAAPEGAVVDGVGTFAFATQLPLPMFNGCIVTDPADTSGVGAALAWLDGLGVPYTVWVPAPVPAAIDALAADDFARVVVGLGLGEETAAQLTAPSFVDRADVDLFVGYLDGVPAGTSVAVSSAGAGGIVNVLTVEGARRRGVGTALTWAAAQAGAVRGHEVLALQATPMGLPVYRAMGFTTVTEYVEYA